MAIKKRVKKPYIAAVFVAFFVLFSVSAHADCIDNMTFSNGGLFNPENEINMQCGLIYIGRSGNIDTIGLDVKSNPFSNSSIKLALYNDTGEGLPYILLANTSLESVVNDTDTNGIFEGWNDFPIVINITKGNYWLCTVSNDLNLFWWSDAGTRAFYNTITLEYPEVWDDDTLYNDFAANMRVIMSSVCNDGMPVSMIFTLNGNSSENQNICLGDMATLAGEANESVLAEVLFNSSVYDSGTPSFNDTYTMDSNGWLGDNTTGLYILTSDANSPYSSPFDANFSTAYGNTIYMNLIDCTEQACVPSWNCTAWGECVRGTQTRTCYDNNFCDDNSTIPALSQECVPNATANFTDGCCPISTFRCLNNDTVIQLWNTSDGVSFAFKDCQGLGCQNGNCNYPTWINSIITLIIVGAALFLIYKVI